MLGIEGAKRICWVREAFIFFTGIFHLSNKSSDEYSGNLVRLILVLVAVFGLFASGPTLASIQFSSSTYSGDEGTRIPITVTRTQGDSSGAASVFVRGLVISGTTRPFFFEWGPGDFSSKTNPTLAPNVDGDQTIDLSLAPRTGSDRIGSPSRATVTVFDTDPPPGTLQFSQSSYSVSEDGRTATITVTRSGGSSGAAAVNYSTSNGTAKSGSDYTAASGTLNWKAGESASKSFTVPILDDNLVEGAETVNLSLSNATGAALGNRTKATLTIQDVEAAGTLQFSESSYGVSEAGGAATITVIRSGGSSGAASVSYSTRNGSATAGSDYTATSGTLNWGVGDGASKTFTVSISNDSLVEGVETVNLSLSNATGATLGSPITATLSIQDDDVAAVGTLQFSQSAIAVAEDSGRVSITVTRSDGSSGPVSVSYATGGGTATAGSDYTAAAGTLDWADGDSASKRFEIQLLEDNLNEANETFNVRLSSPTGGALLGARNTVQITLLDSNPVIVTTSKVEKESGDKLSGGAGDLVGPFTIRVLDQNNQPQANVSVSWSVIPSASATVQNTTTTTDTDGRTSNNLTINVAGTINLRARVPDGGSTQFTVNAIADTPGLNENQQSVGGSLDSACPALAEKQASGGLTAAEQDLLNTCNDLTTSSDQQVGAKLTVLTPENVSSQAAVSVEAAETQVSNIDTRLHALRSGGPSIDFSGLSVNLGGLPLSSMLQHALGSEQGRGGAAGDAASGLVPDWGVFINGEFSFGDKSQTEQTLGFDFDSLGITAGVDYRLTKDLIVGGAVGYAVTDSTFVRSRGSMDLDALHFSVYGTYYRGKQVYIDGVASIAMNSYDSNRLLATNQNAVSDTDGLQYGISLGGGYEFTRGGFSFGPHGRMNYTRLDIDGYTEQASSPQAAGAGSVLTIQDQEAESLRSVLGGSAVYAYSTDVGVFLPTVRLEWEHEFMNDSRLILSQFVHDPTGSIFNVRTEEPDRNYYNLGIGTTVTFAAGRAGFLFYEKRLGHSNVSLDSIKAGLRFEF